MSITNEPLPPPSGLTTAPAPPRRRGWPLLAWVAIAGVVAFILYRAGLRERDRSAYIVTMQMQTRYAMGARTLPGAPSGPALWEQMKAAMEQGDYGQRLRAAIVAGELAGPDEARAVLVRLEVARAANQVPRVTEEGVALAGLLRRLYADRPVSDEEKQRLRDRLGWFGDLALTPPSEDSEAREALVQRSRLTMIGLLLMVGLGLLALVGGLVLGVVLIVLLLIGRLGGGLRTGSGHGGVYAETFALYMIAYVGLGYLLRFVPVDGAAGMMLGGVAMLGSLVVLAWPVLRGIPWRQVRAELGLMAGPSPVKEVLAGVGSYLCALPLLLIALGVTYVLMLLQKHLTGADPMAPGEGPSHPITGVALTRDPWMWVAVVLLAVVLAPLVEEIMFRGVLYRHLREGTRRWGGWLSVLAAVAASGFVFAVIHPQGWLGVPPLMALATSFALTREWRGSLVGPMVAHAINNGVSTLMLFVMAG